jgi:hypothetical protein
MPIYRIDFLDDEGKTRSTGRVDCRDDQEVLRAAAQVIGDHPALEIWDHTRVVGQLTAEECRRLKGQFVRLRTNSASQA